MPAWSLATPIDRVGQTIKHMGSGVERMGSGVERNHFEVSSSLILHNNNEPFLEQILMRNEKWILYDNWQ